MGDRAPGEPASGEPASGDRASGDRATGDRASSTTVEAADRRTVRLRIEGRVQGVGYRAFVERAAVAHGLDGWVRNRRDGGVEAVVSGPAAAVEALIGRCRAGPPAARVDMLRELPEPAAPAPGFAVWPTA